ncbi:MAG: hypothetical protein SFU56_01480 [Capsulimonadales bacterium]|nr:hypothetical protein [Capsulimonadales bacterium]
MYGKPYRPRGGGDEIRRFFLQGGIPLTYTVIGLSVVFFFLRLALPQMGIDRLLAFVTQAWPAQFWTVLTWPLVTEGSPLSLLFAIGWFYLFGGSMERSWGSRAYAAFLAVTVTLTACTTWLGSFIAGPGMLAGLWIVSGPLAVVWAHINRRESVGLFFLPVPAFVMAILGAAMVWYDAGAAYGNPLLGLFALSGCAAAWWYVNHGRSSFRGYATRRNDLGFGTAPRKSRSTDVTPETASRFYRFDRESVDTPRGGFHPLRWWRDRQERKRLEEIFRRSGYSDRDE